MSRIRGAALKKCDRYLYRNSQCCVEPAEQNTGLWDEGNRTGFLALPWMEC